jgi:hypothetical protein
MKNIVKALVLAMLVLGMGTGVYAQVLPVINENEAELGPGDLFTVTDVDFTGLNGSLMAVTPNASALALASVTYGLDGTLNDAALSMIPFTGGGANGGGFNPGNGLTTNFNQTGVADAFGYGSGPFLFPAGSPGNVPQGVPGGPVGPTPPGGGSIASTPSGAGFEGQQIDQVVGKYTASSGFAQNFFTAVQRPATATNNTASSGLFTLEQGDIDPRCDSAGCQAGEEATGGPRFLTFKSQVLFKNGVALDPDIMQLIQQQVSPGTGPFSTCMNCFPGNVIGVSGDTPLGTYPNGQQGGAQVLYNTTVTLSNPGFTADTVTHPGP